MFSRIIAHQSRCLRRTFTHLHQSKCFASGTLVIAEDVENGSSLNAASFNAIQAAQQIAKDRSEKDITCLIATSGEEQSPGELAQLLASVDGVTRVIWASDKCYKGQLVEPLSLLAQSVAKQHNCTHVVMAATSLGKALLPHLSVNLNCSPLSEVTQIISHDTFQRSIYAGNAIQTVQLLPGGDGSAGQPQYCMTVRPTSFDPALPGSSGSNAPAPVDKMRVESSASSALPPTEWIGQELTRSDRPELASAKIVVSGGRGMKSGDNFKLLYELADKLGAAVGASRAAVDAGFVPNDLQVGQTGKIVAPQLYIAIGISGAIQHLAGMKDSKVIVAINKDEEAPIFQVADYGLVEDLFDAVPKMTGLI